MLLNKKILKHTSLDSMRSSMNCQSHVDKIG